jgi:hypothetical protein
MKEPDHYHAEGESDQWLAGGNAKGVARFADDLPELIISGSDPTATAKDLAALIAERDDFLFNGHAPIHIAAEADCLPRALAVTHEVVRGSPTISIPTNCVSPRGFGGAKGNSSGYQPR